MRIHTHIHKNSPTITPPSLLYFLFPSCFSMLSLSLEKLVTCGVIRSYNLGVQTCRLPALKPSRYFLAAPKAPKPHQYLILAFRSAVCQPSNPPNNLQTKAPRPAGAKATYYVPTNIISQRRKGCDGPSKIAILPQFLTFNVHFVRKGYDGPKKSQFYLSF